MYISRQQWGELFKLADEECQCTKEQKNGDYEKRCKPCMAAAYLDNLLIEILQKRHPGSTLLKPYGK